ncbi:hypothetical protein [Streptomyces sp. WM6386]|uniref:hypothetical protein n=1 Tax=Streptomyces sp. WM6386 TaxID=1415558 RepID=UPI000A82E867|nr:hypothetical protein [Streptomyces sp. WM6386]
MFRNSKKRKGKRSGYRAFKSKIISQDARGRFKTWAHIITAAPPEIVKHDDRQLFSTYCRRVAKEDFRETSAAVTIFPILATPGLGLVCAPFVFGALFFSPAASIAAVVMNLLLAKYYARRLPCKRCRVLPVVVTLTAAILGLALAEYRGRLHLPPSGEFNLVDAITFLLISPFLTIVSTTMTFTVIVRGTSIFMDFMRIHYYPDVVVFAELQLVTQVLTDQKDSMMSLNDRQEVIDRLHRAAKCLELGIPRIVQPRDLLSEMAFRKKLRRSANYINSWELAISLSREDSREDLAREIACTLLPLARKDYDALPEADTLAAHRASKRNLGHYVRTAISGASPLAILWILDGLDIFTPSSTIRNGLYVLAFGWMAINYISLLDPLYEGKIAALKDLKDVYTSLQGRDK